jgi:hypothetical protein
MIISKILGYSQNHLAVAGGYVVGIVDRCAAPTRYREVVLTVSKAECDFYE